LKFYSYCGYCHWCEGRRDNTGRKKLLIVDGEGEVDQDVLAMGNNFRLKYEQLLEAYNGG
jgi:hypothetical protein